PVFTGKAMSPEVTPKGNATGHPQVANYFSFPSNLFLEFKDNALETLCTVSHCLHVLHTHHTTPTPEPGPPHTWSKPARSQAHPPLISMSQEIKEPQSRTLNQKTSPGAAPVGSPAETWTF